MLAIVVSRLWARIRGLYRINRKRTEKADTGCVGMTCMSSALLAGIFAAAALMAATQMLRARSRLVRCA
jgi:hypothetical protein